MTMRQAVDFQMMWRFVIFAMFCIATASATAAGKADPPFAMKGDIPDYVASMIEHTYGTHQQSRLVMHHGDWTRVDTTEGDYKTTAYFAGNASLAINEFAKGVGDSKYVEVELHPIPIGWDTEPRNTNERDSVLGETCTVWSAGRVKPSYSSAKSEKLSCLTDDGVELWRRFVGSYQTLFSTEATSIERRRVTVDDVQPPQKLLAVEWWDKDEEKASLFHPDFEAVFEVHDGFRDVIPESGKQTVRTIRRHYPWTYDEERVGGVLSRLTISHASGRMRLWFAGPNGAAERFLSISQYPSTQQTTPRPNGKAMDRSETVLGEQCHWFDTMPGAADAGSAECRTDDGIPLKLSSYGMTSQTLAIAVSLTRRPLTLDDVKPPKDILSLDWWTKDALSQDR